MNAPVDFNVIEGMFRRQYRQIEVRFDPEHATTWTYLKPSGAPCFNLGMLEELRAHDNAIESCGGRVLYKGDLHQIHYYVGASRTEGIFSLGGNLENLVLLIKSGDRDTLMHYAKLCVDNMYQRICGYGAPITTISLVQGEALGGGFETALSSNVIIAERRSRMGLPEMMILSGRVYTAEEMHAAGVVDVLAEDGAGEAAVQDYIRRNERRRNGLQAVFSCRQHFHPVSYEELLNIANLWVSAALRLEEKDLKLMSRLARSQSKRVPGGAAAMPEAGATMEQEQYATA